MNYLVHLYLSGPDPEHQIGGLMGDFVKGPLADRYPVRIRQGLHLHRRIDSFAHDHPDTRSSRQRLPDRYGHGRGIIIDIFYDHFLASAWSAYSVEPLPVYAARIYQLLQTYHDQLPPALRVVAPRMIAHNWLVSYQHRQAVGRALQRLAQRLSRPLPLAEAVGDLARQEDDFLGDFHRFMASARRFAKREINAVPTPAGA
ncbi:MAG: ACP phosphodiesterase [Desulfuromonadales bacterium]